MINVPVKLDRPMFIVLFNEMAEIIQLIVYRHVVQSVLAIDFFDCFIQFLCEFTEMYSRIGNLFL